MKPLENVAIYPLDDRVLIKRDDPDLGNQIIYLLPDTLASEKQLVLLGKVVAVGPNVEELQPGDYVSFGQYVGSKLRYRVGDDKATIEFDIMREKDVQARIIIEGDDEETPG